MVPHKNTAEEVEISFEWSRRRILSTHSKIRTPLSVSIDDFGIERVKYHMDKISIFHTEKYN